MVDRPTAPPARTGRPPGRASDRPPARWPARLRGPALVAVAVAVAVVGFGVGLWAAGGGGGDGGDEVATAGGDDAVAPTSTVGDEPPPTAPATSTSTSTTSAAAGSPGTTDPAPPATPVPPGPPGSPGVLVVGYAGQEALGHLVVPAGGEAWVILSNTGGTSLTWAARSTGAAALGTGTSFAGVLDPGQSGGVPVTAAAAAAAGDEGTLTLSDGEAATVVDVVVG